MSSTTVPPSSKEIEIAFNKKIYEGWIFDIEEIRQKYNLPDQVVAATFIKHTSNMATATRIVKQNLR